MILAIREEVDEYHGGGRSGLRAPRCFLHGPQHVQAFVRAGPRGPRARRRGTRVRARPRARSERANCCALDALLESYLIGQRTFWEAIVAAAGDTPEGLRAAQELTAFTFALHARDQRRRRRGLPERERARWPREVERGRRDLLDRLLSGRPPGPREEERRAEALGLAAGTRVVVAEPSERVDHAHAGARGRRSWSRATARSIAHRARRTPAELRAALEPRRRRAASAPTASPARRREHRRARDAGRARAAATARPAARCATPNAVVVLEDDPALRLPGRDRRRDRPPAAPARHRASSRRWPRRCDAYADCDLNVAKRRRAAQRPRQHGPLPAAARARADRARPPALLRAGRADDRAAHHRDVIAQCGDAPRRPARRRPPPARSRRRPAPPTSASTSRAASSSPTSSVEADSPAEALEALLAGPTPGGARQGLRDEDPGRRQR